MSTLYFSIALSFAGRMICTFAGIIPEESLTVPLLIFFITILQGVAGLLVILDIILISKLAKNF